MDNGFNNFNNNPDLNGNGNSFNPEENKTPTSETPQPGAQPSAAPSEGQPYSAQPSYNGSYSQPQQGYTPYGAPSAPTGENAYPNGPQNKTYGYSYGPGSVNTERPYGNQPVNNGPVQTKKSKPKKPKKGTGISTGILCLLLACTIVISAAAGFGTAFLTLKLNSNKAPQGGSTVIYESTAPAVSEIGKDGVLSVPQVAAKVADSVVEITTETVTTSLFYGQYVMTGAGSGVIISEDGYIVTNNHVIDGATHVSVITKNGNEYDAKFVGRDRKTDLAVVKIEATGLQPAVLGDSSKVVAGQSTVVIGNPLGSLGGSVTAGIVSALDRQITVDKQTMTLMQLDAAINPGNSGGGAFDLNGNLIGIVNAKSTGQDIDNLGFAIPVNTVKKVLDDLIEFGYVTGRLSTGFTPIDLTDPSTAMNYRVDRTGIYVYSVQDADSSFRRGDLLVSMDGTVISSMGDYNAVVDRHKVGDQAEATVIRKGEQKTVTFTFREYVPSEEETPAPTKPSSQKLPDIFDFFF